MLFGRAKRLGIRLSYYYTLRSNTILLVLVPFTRFCTPQICAVLVNRWSLITIDKEAGQLRFETGAV